MSEIERLTQRVAQLTQGVDRWNTFMVWGLAVAAIAAIAVLVSTRIIVFKARDLSSTQDALDKAKDRQLQFDLKQKDQEIAKAQEQAAEANERADKAKQGAATAGQLAGEADLAAARANAHASDLDRQAEELRLQNLSMQRGIQETKTKFEEERIARLELEATIAPREPFTIVEFGDNHHGASSNIDELKLYAGQDVIIEHVDEHESKDAAEYIAELLSSAQWHIVSNSVKDGLMPGVTILRSPLESSEAYGLPAFKPVYEKVTGAQDAIVSFLRSCEWKTEKNRTQEKLKNNPIALLIEVGAKPDHHFKSVKEKNWQKEIAEYQAKEDAEYEATRKARLPNQGCVANE